MKKNARFLMLPFLMMGLLVMLSTTCTEVDDPDPVLKDIDGNVYKTVKLDDQIWMAENLKTTKLSDGSAIPLITLDTEWATLTSPGYCWYNNDRDLYGETYGALYNWYTVNTEKLCPSGWHIPTDAEWTALTTYLGGDSIAAGLLKETLTDHWLIPNTGATNETNFTALPNGYRDTTGVYFGAEHYGYWWSSTSISGVSAWNRTMSYASNVVSRPGAFVQNGFAVRCVKN